ncbi:CPBP family intramembrane glutamic endopeptidase [Methylobacterium iners]|uniref:CAAX prenyl protease 2/Lysostaphin resistance protein A-like domain-containing protein n=1 Tax=Methylobacterium iners TaxID=418707 RepID=A0ABQ4S0S3_9HYPH|nr:type II CAAX endopeptidase family protein [Methylobacterium iners]GJD96710.1 hypothetical protein OCOJLMKI_3935 [Methylobacterium iners]
MKPVPGTEATDAEQGAGSRPGEAPRGRVRAAALTLLHLLALGLTVLLYLAVASLIALAIVRVGADLRDGIDPFAAQDRRPPLHPSQIAMRELALDIVRQVVLALLVVATALWRDRSAWRQRLALDRTRPPGLRASRLLLILLVWPAFHILWVTGTATLFHAPFGHQVALSPMLTAAALAAWLAYVVVLAPTAEELLMRGEAFARARAFLGPAGAIMVTAALFALAHLSSAGLARPISLLPLALTLGWLRWRTGRLWPCIALHGWSNLAFVAYLLWP